MSVQMMLPSCGSLCSSGRRAELVQQLTDARRRCRSQLPIMRGKAGGLPGILEQLRRSFDLLGQTRQRMCDVGQRNVKAAQRHPKKPSATIARWRLRPSVLPERERRTVDLVRTGQRPLSGRGDARSPSGEMAADRQLALERLPPRAASVLVETLATNPTAGSNTTVLFESLITCAPAGSSPTARADWRVARSAACWRIAPSSTSPCGPRRSPIPSRIAGTRGNRRGPVDGAPASPPRRGAGGCRRATLRALASAGSRSDPSRPRSRR